MRVAIVTAWVGHDELVDDFFDVIRSGRLHAGDYVLIVDNGSRPRLWDTLHRRPDKPAGLLDIRLEENVGFARASNVGLRVASRMTPPADAIVFLNNDVALAPGGTGWLDLLRGALEPRVLVGARMRSDDHARVDGKVWPYLDGWCLAGLRDDLLELGGFDEELTEPAYFSDNLLCLNARRAGMRLREVRVGVVHKGNRTAPDAGGTQEEMAKALNYARYAAAVRELRAA